MLLGAQEKVKNKTKSLDSVRRPVFGAQESRESTTALDVGDAGSESDGGFFES